MYVPFEQLSDEARVWVYAANRPFSPAELHPLVQGLTTFIESWTAHNHELKGSFQLIENQFIVLSVDENHQSATGCSIDKSVHFLQVIEQEFNIQLFNRVLVYYYAGEELITTDRTGFESLLQQGKITATTTVVNTLVFTKKELTEKFRLPMAESWHARVFSLATAGC